MKLNMAALCDRATIREGLLHVLGAGVTRTSLALPGPVDLDLAILIRAETWTELAGRHSLVVTLSHENGTRLGQIEMGWETSTVPEDEPLPQLPIVVPLRQILLAEEGEHHVRVEIDGVEVCDVHFQATKAHIPGVTLQFR
ncbi:DUF6941 family protein [Streptomyces sp. NPDC057837]|uniref:DUF6941 family protein n=1 Tax=Streptomyces sp. NPDC057837 TaxID=3346260 RepID=UPI00367C4143